MNANNKNISLIFKALNFVAGKHRDQRRKGPEAAPYINHLIGVADILWEIGQVRDISVIIAGILHDTLEDTSTSTEELAREFGAHILSIVEEVTDDKRLPKSERKRIQIERAGNASLEARQVKLADKIFNVHDLIEAPPTDWSLQRQRNYVDWSESVVNQLRGSNERLEQHFDSVIQHARAHLAKQA